MATRSVRDHVRSDNGSELIATVVRDLLGNVGVRTLRNEPGSPWENGYVESLNGNLRDELLNGEIFYTVADARELIERWREHYNRVRPHSALGYRPPSPKAIAASVGKGYCATVDSTSAKGSEGRQPASENKDSAMPDRRGLEPTWFRVWNVTPEAEYSTFIQVPAGSPIAKDPLSEVGCPYVVRGFDFDQVGLLWLSDLVWRRDRWVVQLEHADASHTRHACLVRG